MKSENCRYCEHYLFITDKCLKHKRHIEDISTCSYGNPSLVDDSLWVNTKKKKQPIKQNKNEQRANC